MTRQEQECLLQTIYATFPNEPPIIQLAMVWVILNRTTCNRPEWGGYTIIGVCRKFPCWKDRGGVQIPMHNKARRKSIESWLPNIYKTRDPTGNAVMFHNPVWPLAAQKPKPSETEYVQSKKIGYWIFYKLRDTSA